MQCGESKTQDPGPCAHRTSVVSLPGFVGDPSRWNSSMCKRKLIWIGAMIKMHLQCQISRKTGRLWEEWGKHCPVLNKVPVPLLQQHVCVCRAECRGAAREARYGWQRWHWGLGAGWTLRSRSAALSSPRCFPSPQTHHCFVRAKVDTHFHCLSGKGPKLC